MHDTPDRLVKAALDLSGRIDVLINNAGLMTFADMLTVEAVACRPDPTASHSLDRALAPPP